MSSLFIEIYVILDEVNADCDQFSLVEKELCIQHHTTEAATCTDMCMQDETCVNNCLILKSDNIAGCPCHQNCYFGCGKCSSWECKDNTPVDPR